MRTLKHGMVAGAVFAIATSVQAQQYNLGGWQVSGSIEGVGQYVSGSMDNSAQFNKFRDISTGATGNLGLSAEKDDYEMQLRAFDIGRKDQEYRLNGGKYGSFDYELFYNQIINHKATLNVKTIWANPGDTTLTLTPGLSRTVDNFGGDGFTSFEYSNKRQDFGVKANLFKDTPYFVTIGYDHELLKGVRPWGVNPAASTSEMINELPEPLDYATDNATLVAGYRTDRFITSVDGYFSNFKNNLTTLTWTPPSAVQNASQLSDTEMLIPGNTFLNANLRGTVYDLPLESTAAAKAGYSRITSSFDVENTANTPNILGSNGATANVQSKIVTTDRPDFQGRIEYYSANFSVASRPLTKLDTRLYYNFLNKKNSSSLVSYTFTPASTNNPSGTSGSFGYEKHNAGLDVSYKLPFSTKLGGGYEYLRITRTDRPTNPGNTDHKANVSVTNNSLDWLTSKLYASYLTRLSETGLKGSGANPLNGQTMYDANSKRQTTVGLEFEAYPLERLDAGLGVSYGFARYTDVSTSGRKQDQILTASADVGYEFSDWLRATLYGDVEQFTGLMAFSTTNDATRFDQYYTAGMNFGMPIIPEKADLTAGYQYHRGNGNLESYTTYGNDIPAVDTYTKHSLNAKATYKVTKNITAKAGYIFSTINPYNDSRQENYQYYQVTTSANARTNLTGAETDVAYTAHTGYVAAEYMF